MKNRICVIFTGGTIGSALKDGAVSLENESKSLLLSEYEKKFGGDVVFDTLSPVNMHSENVLPSDHEKIADCIRGVDVSRYDGIILTHGTDTLCFTANYLSRIFCGIAVPVVIVSASYPLGDPRGNGYINFAGAVTFIGKAGCKGVFVSFANDGEPCKIHLASRLTDSEQMDCRFESLLRINFGTVEDGKFLRNPDPRNPDISEICVARENADNLSLCGEVLTVNARALLDFDYYSFATKKPKAVIIRLYHSGTVCTAGENTDAEKFARRCLNAGIDVVLSPVSSRANVYKGMKNTFEGCIKAYDISFEMTVVKVMLALGSGIPVRDMLSENAFFEKV